MNPALILAALAQAQTPPPATPPAPTIIPAPGGGVALVGPGDRESYDRFNYAPIRRAGDHLYISGVIIGSAPDAPKTRETFKEGARRALRYLRNRLAAFDATFDDVVMINSFHDWTAEEFKGDRLAQLNALNEAKREFMKAPHPAWTAVGTSGLLAPGGVVEVQMIAYKPLKR
jgi:enamine deaminase RidA (YjgF/YER057c/UK114 family)